jgi:hypothetical protein
VDAEVGSGFGIAGSRVRGQVAGVPKQSTGAETQKMWKRLREYCSPLATGTDDELRATDGRVWSEATVPEPLSGVRYSETYGNAEYR